MSFTSDVKEDLINRTNNDISLDIMEIDGMLRLSSEISLIGGLSISFTQGQMSIIRKLITLLKGKYDIDYEIESRVVNRLDNHTVYTAYRTIPILPFYEKSVVKIQKKTGYFS